MSGQTPMPWCHSHPTRRSIGTINKGGGRIRPVCDECRTNAAVLGLNFSFKPHEAPTA